MSSFKLCFLAADRPFFDGKCESLVMPTSQGEYGILANHRNMIAAIIPGVIRFRPEGEETMVASVSDGIVKVENGDVLILVDTAEHPEEIDINRQQREIDDAKEALLQKRSILEYQAQKARLARAVSRLKAKNYNLHD